MFDEDEIKEFLTDEDSNGVEFLSCKVFRKNNNPDYAEVTFKLRSHLEICLNKNGEVLYISLVLITV